MTTRLSALVTLPMLLCAQDALDTIAIPAGTTQSVAVQITTPPVAQDAIYFQVSTKRLKITLVTPDGRRVTKASAQQNGFDWGEVDFQAPIGSTDAGGIGSMHFVRPGAAGRYVVEFTAPPGVQNATASAGFKSENQKYTESTSGIPGFQKVGPYLLTPGQRPLVVILDQDEEAAIFDLLTTAGAQLSLTLPDGTIVTSSVGERGKIGWKTGRRDQMDPPGAMFGIAGLLLHEPGIHQVVTMEKAVKGRYQVHALGSPAQVTAAFIPFGRMVKEPAAPPPRPSGETRIQGYALPYDAKVGDRLTAMIGIVGEPLSNPQFAVKMEYRTLVSRDPVQYSAPIVESAPAVFSLDPGNRYTTTIVPRRPGIMRVGVKVTGTRRNGQPFSDETLLTEVMVTPVVARLLGLTETPVDVNKNGKFDRLDITAKLSVVVPGEFEMRVDISSGKSGALLSTRKQLAAGEHTLTVTLSAREIRERFADGMWTILPPKIYQLDGTAFGEFVAVPENRKTSGPYKLADWER